VLKHLDEDSDDTVIEDVQYRLTESQEKSPLLVNDVEMNVRYIAGDKIEEDVNCDSTWMLDNIRKVGEAIRSAFYWIPVNVKCYLYMDNAGGHGTEDAINEYTKILETKYNIEIVHQVPRSLETNCLDLGIWCSLRGLLIAF